MFIRIGDRCINLNNVTQIAHRKDADNRPFIQIDYNGDQYTRFYSHEPEYAVVEAWMNEQTHIKQYADVYARIATALELLERR
jgi:hypothetical protein